MCVCVWMAGWGELHPYLSLFSVHIRQAFQSFLARKASLPPSQAHVNFPVCQMFWSVYFHHSVCAHSLSHSSLLRLLEKQHLFCHQFCHLSQKKPQNKTSRAAFSRRSRRESKSDFLSFPVASRRKSRLAAVK